MTIMFVLCFIVPGTSFLLSSPLATALSDLAHSYEKLRTALKPSYLDALPKPRIDVDKKIYLSGADAQIVGLDNTPKTTNEWIDYFQKNRHILINFSIETTHLWQTIFQVKTIEEAQLNDVNAQETIDELMYGARNVTSLLQKNIDEYTKYVQNPNNKPLIVVLYIIYTTYPQYFDACARRLTGRQGTNPYSAIAFIHALLIGEKAALMVADFYNGHRGSSEISNRQEVTGFDVMYTLFCKAYPDAARCKSEK